MIAPKPFKYKCPKCGYSRIVKPKSDALGSVDIISICSKCKSNMEQKELNTFDNIKSIFKI